MKTYRFETAKFVEYNDAITVLTAINGEVARRHLDGWILLNILVEEFPKNIYAELRFRKEVEAA